MNFLSNITYICARMQVHARIYVILDTHTYTHTPYRFGPIIPLLGMQPREIYSTGEINSTCKDVCRNIIYDLKNGSAKRGSVSKLLHISVREYHRSLKMQSNNTEKCQLKKADIKQRAQVIVPRFLYTFDK